MTTNLHSREKGQAEQGTAHPGDKCWQDFMAYLEAPTDGNGKADRLVCKLDRDLADSLDDCDIRGRCRFRPRERHHPLVLRETTFPYWRNTAARRNHCSTTITPNPMRRIDWTETMLSRLAELYPVETTAHTAYMLQIGVTAREGKSPRTRTGEAGQEPVAGTCRTYQPPLRQPLIRRDGRRPGASAAPQSAAWHASLGLSRSKAKGYAMSSRVRNELVRPANGAGLYSVLTPSHASRLSHTAPRSGYAPG